MPFTVARIGSGLTAPATEFELAYNPNKNPDFFCVRRAGQMHHTAWDFLDDNNLFESVAQSDPAGQDLAIAAYDGKRVLSMHRVSTSKLKMQVFETGGVFALEDELEFVKDTQPQIVPFGAPVRKAPSPVGAAVRGGSPKLPLEPAPRPAPGGGGTTAGGGGVSTRRPGQPVKVEPVGELVATLKVKIGRAVVGTKTAAGQLRLTSWGFQGGGDVAVALGYGASTLAGEVKAFSLAKVGENRADGKLLGVDILAAVIAPDDKLKVQRWRLTLGTTGVPSAFAKVSEVTALESVTKVSCCTVSAMEGTHAVTAVRVSSGGALKVIAWKMEAGGGITRLQSATGGPIAAVEAAAVRGPYFVTGVQEADERFKCQFWRFPSTDAGPMEALASDGEGKIDAVIRAVTFAGKSPKVGDAVFAVREKDVAGLRLWRYRLTEV